jgi:hypothetical protein
MKPLNMLCTIALFLIFLPFLSIAQIKQPPQPPEQNQTITDSSLNTTDPAYQNFPENINPDSAPNDQKDLKNWQEPNKKTYRGYDKKRQYEEYKILKKQKRVV